VTAGATTQAKGGDQTSNARVITRRVLEEPTDVSVNAAILATDKIGADLVVRLSNGETLTIENFFVIGPDGDFSRLLSASGAPVLTGLLGPEPDMPQDTELTAAMQPAQGIGPANAEDISAGGTEPRDTSDWGDTALIAGAGLSLGSGIGFLSEDDSDPAPAAATTDTQSETQTDFALEIEALTGPEDANLHPSEFEASTAESSDEQAEESSFGVDDANATKMPEISGFLDSDSPDPNLLPVPDLQDSLLEDLIMEVI
jgi:hypothetical protein